MPAAIWRRRGWRSPCCPSTPRAAPARRRSRRRRPDPVLVSTPAANPEIGTVQPLKEIARVTRAAGVPLHVDGVGAIGRVPLGGGAMGRDLLTLSGKALYGPP